MNNMSALLAFLQTFLPSHRGSTVWKYRIIAYRIKLNERMQKYVIIVNGKNLNKAIENSKKKILHFLQYKTIHLWLLCACTAQAILVNQSSVFDSQFKVERAFFVDSVILLWILFEWQVSFTFYRYVRWAACNKIQCLTSKQLNKLRLTNWLNQPKESIKYCWNERFHNELFQKLLGSAIDIHS